MSQKLAPATEAEALRAQRARLILDDPEFKECVLEVERAIRTSWEKGKTVQEREAAHAQLLALQQVVLKLRTAYERGQIAKEAK